MIQDPTNERRTETKKQWDTPALKTIGHVTEVVQGGGGKLSLAGGDPGEGRKQRGGG